MMRGRQRKILRLIHRARHDLDVATQALLNEVDVDDGEIPPVTDELNEIQSRVGALELRVAAIERKA